MGTTSRRSRTVARAVLTVGVTLAAMTATSAPGSAAAQVSTASQAQLAAAWLADQLATDPDGLFADPLVTADAILALEATGTEETAAQQAMQSLVANAPTALGAAGEESVNTYGKLAVTAIAGGVDPTDFAGVDLLATLRSLECGAARTCDADLEDPADELGQFADGADDDASNVSSQAWAILALERALAKSWTTSGASAEAVRFLLANQCPDGGFPPGFFGRDIDDWDADAPACESDPAVTGLVVQTLVLVGENCDAIRKATDYLVATRSVSGSWSVKSGNSYVVNGWSTAWASQALTAVGLETAGSRSFLTTLQEADGSVSFLAGSLVLLERATPTAATALAEQPLGILGDGAPAPAAYVCAEPVAPPTPTVPTPTTTSPTVPTPTTTTPTTHEPTNPGRLTSTISNRTGTDLTNGGTELPRTGAMSWPLAMTGTFLLAAGAGLVAAARRRPRSARS